MSVALVTGAGRGIGAAAARRLAADGWQLVVFDRCRDDDALPYPLATEADLKGVADECDAVPFVGDVRSRTDVAEAVALATETYGGLDAAIGAAGVIAGGPPLWDLPEPAWDIQVGVNLTGAYHLAVAAVPAMLARPEPRQGRFVAVASAASTSGNPRIAAYNATKAGVVGLVRGLAADLGGTGITANAVSPGSTRTPILDASAAIYDLDDPDAFAEHHMDRRILDPVEIADVVAWLCSPSASAVTGADIPADAGMSAR